MYGINNNPTGLEKRTKRTKVRRKYKKVIIFSDVKTRP